jgi:hypothetical protein
MGRQEQPKIANANTTPKAATLYVEPAHHLISRRLGQPHRTCHALSQPLPWARWL